MQIWSSIPLLLAAVWLLRSALLWLASEGIKRDQLGRAALCQALALGLWPFSAAGWTSLGNLLGDLGRWQLAQPCFVRASQIRPDWIEAWLGIGIAVLVLEQDPQMAHQAFLRAYCLRRGTPLNLRASLGELSPQAELEPAQAHKLAHDAEQIEALVRTQRLDASLLTLAENFLKAAETPLEAPALYQQALYLEPASLSENLGRLRYLSPRERSQIEARYLESGRMLTWYDEMLQPEALRVLHELCLYSTFWHHVYRKGYLGAYLDDGFSSPLLYQLAQELQLNFPLIFGDTRLVYLWAFKCRAQAPGVALHHDSALVNVNFWLTPDSANRDPDSGGICVYPQEPPQSWDLERYQIGPEQMQQFIKGVEPVCVPYRQNRVVIFNSRLFHATQPFDFEPGFAQERINVTLLFGRQPLRYHPKRQLVIPG